MAILGGRHQTYAKWTMGAFCNQNNFTSTQNVDIISNGESMKIINRKNIMHHKLPSEKDLKELEIFSNEVEQIIKETNLAIDREKKSDLTNKDINKLINSFNLIQKKFISFKERVDNDILNSIFEMIIEKTGFYEQITKQISYLESRRPSLKGEHHE